jgi:hypothetical protein
MSYRPPTCRTLVRASARRHVGCVTATDAVNNHWRMLVRAAGNRPADPAGLKTVPHNDSLQSADLPTVES